MCLHFGSLVQTKKENDTFGSGLLGIHTWHLFLNTKDNLVTALIEHPKHSCEKGHNGSALIEPNLF